MTYKVGVIGLGIMGQRMVQCMLPHPHFEVLVGWDIQRSTSEGVQRDLAPNMKIAADAQALIADPALDLIYIASPPTSHLAYAQTAMNAGKAIFCEKPLAVHIEASRQMVTELAKCGLPNAVNFPFAASQEVATLEKHIQEGRHGEAQLLEISFHFSEWPRTWQRDAASWLSGRVEGGFLREVFSHFVYLTQRIIGPLTIQSAQLNFPADGITAETYVMANLESNGLPIRVSGGVGGAAPDYNAWTLFGSQKSYRFYDWRLMQVADLEGWHELVPEIEPKPLMGDQLDALAEMLTGNPHCLPDFAAALAVQEIVEGLLQ
ncbi:MAG: Gfo/Idh/MocA family oxidoreductase [Anaerolineales bacterium]|nr:Gfo/Idh/MocA family oxidoreductase [Chloroflexota bacterium]MBL6983403.1 Gfo/Idh/MocA family oxidoreductase [Anaerolineales bacterium]